MASYLIIDTIRTDCALPGADRTHVSSVVLDRGGAYLVTDVIDFMEHGHTFIAARPFGLAEGAATDPTAGPVSRTRCRHCGRPTLRLAAEPSIVSEPDLPAPRSTRHPATTGQSSPAAAVPPSPGGSAVPVGRRRRGNRRDQYVDNASTK